MSHSPGAFFKARMLDNPEGADSADTERYVFGEFSASRFQRRLVWHRRYYSNYCGDIEHGNIGPRGYDNVIFTAAHGGESLSLAFKKDVPGTRY